MSLTNPAWREFLRAASEHTHVTLVGPLHDRPHFVDRPTVFVDGGSRFRPEAARFPTASVGDGDSGRENLDLLLPADKDYSDLAFALRALPDSIREIQLLGFLGGRRDHELLVFGEVHHFLAAKTRFTMVRFEDQVVAFNGAPMKLEIEGQFSLITFAPTEVKLTGACRYKLESPAPIEAVSSRGLSNEGFGMVTIAAGAPCFVFLRHKP